ncbi:MAG: hypothetical protein JSV18_07540 [Candidatus Bathyarchaeota archaeon]|nr:MAG: hypothetical protein JSV18_07540 [Candidatus Bathyarchaeota archaeon]
MEIGCGWEVRRGVGQEYKITVAVHIRESLNGITVSFSKVLWEALEHISAKRINDILEVTRVVDDISNKPPATIRWV